MKNVNSPKKKNVKFTSNIHKKRATFLKLISEYTSKKTILKFFKIKESAYYRRLKRYIDKGYLNKDYTLTQLGLDYVKSHTVYSKTYTLKQDSVRLHNLVFTVSVKLKKWNKRRRFLKIKNIKYKRVGNNWEGERIIIDNIKVWFTPKSIIFYMPEYYGEDADICTKNAINDLFKYIYEVEKILNCNFKGVNGYSIRVSRNHYSLIQNSLARQYNDSKRKLFVRGKNGLWLLIDDSMGLNELETVHPKTGLDDNRTVQDFFNDLKENPATISQILSTISQTTANQNYFNENLKRHYEVLNQMSNTLKKIEKKIG